MSNWVKAKVETLKDVRTDYFEKALANMGFTANFDVKTVKGAYSSDGNRGCDCVLFDLRGNNVQIGMSFDDNGDGTTQMTVVSDWYSQSYTPESFMEKFTLEYNTVKYQDVAASLGMSIESTENLADGRRKIVCRRAA